MLENLKAAIAGETYQYTEMYPEFARVAKEEGYKDIAGRLKSIAVAEKHHGERYAKLLGASPGRHRVQEGRTCLVVLQQMRLYGVRDRATITLSFLRP